MKNLLLLTIMLMCALNFNAQDYSQVYLIGGAAPNGWANDKAEIMTLKFSGDESAIFEWTGALKPGDFKFINKLNTWNPCFNALTQNESIILNNVHNLVYNPDGNNDHKFVIQEAGIYTVTIDLKKLTMVVNETQHKLPEELWVIGSAIPNGISKLSNAYEVANFLYIGKLQQGDLKIITTETINEFTQYIVPFEEDVDVTGVTKFIISKNASLPGWNVIVPHLTYKMKINVIGEQMTAGIFTSHDNLYMVGGATKVGWHANQALPFVKDNQNPDIFIFDGDLKVRTENVESGAFKIIGQLDWGPLSLHPYNAGESILDAKHFRIGGEDTKWQIDENHQGRYIIKINMLYETIESEYIGDGTGIKKHVLNPYFNVSYVSNGIRINMLANYVADAIHLYSLNGQLVHAIRNAGQEAVLGYDVMGGIYILKVECGKKSFVQRIIIK
ncbi:hypothetical protein MASR2M117_00890 [Paludibacter sp.]